MSVHFKFKSAIDYDTVTFEGTHITVSDLKKLIAVKKKLGKTTDFDLVISNAQSQEEYRDEAYQIPKNTSLIVSRVPCAAHNKYSGQGGGGHSSAPMTAPTIANPTPAPLIVKDMAVGSDPLSTENESARINALLQTQAGLGTGLGRGPPGHRDYHQRPQHTFPTDRIVAPPPTYICHRCNQPGHFINQCPTNGDPNYNHYKAKKASGIPKIFLRQVQNPGTAGSSTVLMPGGGVAVVLTH
eukprot:gene15222-18013_t